MEGDEQKVRYQRVEAGKLEYYIADRVPGILRYSWVQILNVERL